MVKRMVKCDLGMVRKQIASEKIWLKYMVRLFEDGSWVLIKLGMSRNYSQLSGQRSIENLAFDKENKNAIVSLEIKFL